MEHLELLLYPIIFSIEKLSLFFFSLTGSMGQSIIIVGFIFSLILIPLRLYGERVEEGVARKIADVDQELRPWKTKLKGEALFDKTEQIYKTNGYHPIQSILLGSSFLIALPVLLSAIFVYSGDGILSGKNFLFINDLSEPDRLFGRVNLLPFVMFGVSIFDAQMRFFNDKKSRNRFYVISIILLVLVYDLAAGLVLYWTASNVMSLMLSRVKAART